MSPPYTSRASELILSLPSSSINVWPQAIQLSSTTAGPGYHSLLLSLPDPASFLMTVSGALSLSLSLSLQYVSLSISHSLFPPLSFSLAHPPLSFSLRLPLSHYPLPIFLFYLVFDRFPCIHFLLGPNRRRQYKPDSQLSVP